MAMPMTHFLFKQKLQNVFSSTLHGRFAEGGEGGKGQGPLQGPSEQQ